MESWDKFTPWEILREATFFILTLAILLAIARILFGVSLVGWLPDGIANTIDYITNPSLKLQLEFNAPPPPLPTTGGQPPRPSYEYDVDLAVGMRSVNACLASMFLARDECMVGNVRFSASILVAYYVLYGVVAVLYFIRLFGVLPLLYRGLNFAASACSVGFWHGLTEQANEQFAEETGGASYTVVFENEVVLLVLAALSFVAFVLSAITTKGKERLPAVVEELVAEVSDEAQPSHPSSSVVAGN